MTLARLVHELDALDGLQATNVKTSTHRMRAWNAACALEAGRVDPSAVSELERRWQHHFGASPALPGTIRDLPDAQVGVSYWLSSDDARGKAIRLRLERLVIGVVPWPRFWSLPAPDAEGEIDHVFGLCRRLLTLAPAEPRQGWHRIVSHDSSYPEEMLATLRLAGNSFKAPVALMVLSRWLDQPLDPSIACTGDVDPDGRISLPDHSASAVRAKAIALRREWPCVRTFFVPRGCRPDAVEGIELVEVDTVRELAKEAGLVLDRNVVGPVTVPAFVQVAREIAEAARTRSAPQSLVHRRLRAYVDAHAELERAVSATGHAPDDLRVHHLHLMALLGSHETHAGDREGFVTTSARIDALIADAAAGSVELPHSLLALTRNVQASGLVDVHRFATARSRVAAAAEHAHAAKDGLELARITSTAARIAAHAGDDDAALIAFDDAIARFHRVAPWESNIAATYRVGALARLGRFDEARRSVVDLRTPDPVRGPILGWVRDNDAYLAYEELKLELAAGDLAAAEKCFARLDDARITGWAWPGSGALARGVESAARSGARDLALQRARRLRELPGAIPHQVGRAAAWLALTDSGDVDDELRTWLGWIPDGEESPFTAPRDACRAALDAGDRRRVKSALEQLVRAEIY